MPCVWSDRVLRIWSIVATGLWVIGCSSPATTATSEVVFMSSPPLERGYVRRACGFDMNRNGIIGEPDDCDVCDGETTDPDGDGVDEDLIYIDVEEGSDRGGNGSPERPYRSIQFAWNAADGPGDGAEDILCFRGWATTEETIRPGTRGLPATYTVPRTGSQARDWQFPQHPTMLVGWDSDNDGAYPPYDPDDIAVLDGSGDGARHGLARVFHLQPANDYVEIAHFQVHDYGRFSFGVDSGFIRFGPRGDGVDHTYYHDVELYALNKARKGDGGKDFAIDIFHSGLHWANFSNLLFVDNGGWFVRGSGPDSGLDDGPLRWQNISRTVHGCDFTDCGEMAGWPGVKVWGYISRIEFLDSVFDTNVAHWEPNPNGGHGGTMLVVGQCTQDWTIRNNEFIDPAIALRIQPASDGFCDNQHARPIEKVVFDRNIVRNTYGAWGYGNVGVDVSKFERNEGDVPGESLGDLTITNNFLSTVKVGWESCVHVGVGNHVAPPPGQILIANNTCVGEIRRAGAITIGALDEDPDPRYLQQNIVIKNNVIAGLSEGQANIQTSYEPADLDSDTNVFDQAGVYRWVDGEDLDLANWKDVSGVDEGSRECQPAFENEAGGDFHLQRNDTCAQGKGESLMALDGLDIDGDPRPEQEVSWDAGADQVQTVLPEEPPYRFAASPSDIVPGGTTEIQMSLTTNETGICRWSGEPGASYSEMEETFAVTNGQTHSTMLYDLENGEHYSYFIRCLDVLGNANTEDFPISFTVADLRTGLVGYWSMDQESGNQVRDQSDSGHDGQLVGGPIWSEGHSGNALLFDGRQSHVSVEPAAGLNKLNQLTLSGWVKLAPASCPCSIFDKSESEYDGFGMSVDASGRVRVTLNDTFLTSNRLVADGRWRHLVAVYDGQDLKLFVDGTEDRWDWMNAGGLETLSPLKIGAPRSGRKGYLTGSLDELRIYDRPLSDEEIEQLASGAK